MLSAAAGPVGLSTAILGPSRASGSGARSWGQGARGLCDLDGIPAHPMPQDRHLVDAVRARRHPRDQAQHLQVGGLRESSRWQIIRKRIETSFHKHRDGPGDHVQGRSPAKLPLEPDDI